MDDELWHFAVAFYARPGVETDCLYLQEQGADVCLVLCLAWLDQRRVVFAPERLIQLQQVAEPWQRQAVQPLRQLRTAWREAARHDPRLAALRKKLKGLELDAERALLDKLQITSAPWPEDNAQQPRWIQQAGSFGDRGRAALARLTGYVEASASKHLPS